MQFATFGGQEGVVMLWNIFSSFVKIGTFTFGGGYAMLPMLNNEVIERHGWLSAQEVADYYALAQCLPGVIAINTAAFVGRRVAGKAGSVAACVGVILPSFVVITLIAAFIQNFLEYEIVQSAFFGIRAVVCALIVRAITGLWKPAIRDKIGIYIYIIALVIAIFSNIHIVALIVMAAVVGIIVYRPKVAEGER